MKELREQGEEYMRVGNYLTWGWGRGGCQLWPYRERGGEGRIGTEVYPSLTPVG